MSLGHPLDDSLYLTLTDHIYFSVERARKEVFIHNALLVETKMIYREEFAVALEAIQYLNARFGVELPEDETASITLHLVNASSEGATLDETIKSTQIVQEVNVLAQRFYDVQVDPNSLDYYRLLVHFKFFASRLVSSAQHEDEELVDRQIFEVVRTQYANAYECATCIGALLDGKYGYQVNDSELMYLPSTSSACTEGTERAGKAQTLASPGILEPRASAMPIGPNTRPATGVGAIARTS